MLDRKYRIHQEKQYKKIFAKGKKQVGRYMVLLFLPNHLEWTRIGIITSKKVGKAHERNYAKRRLRAILWENFSSIPAGYDMVLIARVSIQSADYEKIQKDFLHLLKKGRL